MTFLAEAVQDRSLRRSPIAESESQTPDYDETVAELADEVQNIKDGLQRLTKSHVEVDHRLAKIEKSLDSFSDKFNGVNQSFARLESLILSEKPHGKGVASVSGNPSQVSSPHWEQNPDVNSLGYRSGNWPLDSRDSLLKRIELPMFDGNSPFSWIARAERFFRVVNMMMSVEWRCLDCVSKGLRLNWYNAEMDREPFLDWSQFKCRMLQQYNHRRKVEPENMDSSKGVVVAQETKLFPATDSISELSSMVPLPGLEEPNLIKKVSLEEEMIQQLELSDCAENSAQVVMQTILIQQQELIQAEKTVTETDSVSKNNLILHEETTRVEEHCVVMESSQFILGNIQVHKQATCSYSHGSQLLGSSKTYKKDHNRLQRNVYFSVWHCWRKKKLQNISLTQWLLQTLVHHIIQGSRFWTSSTWAPQSTTYKLWQYHMQISVCCSSTIASTVSYFLSVFIACANSNCLSNDILLLDLRTILRNALGTRVVLILQDQI